MELFSGKQKDEIRNILLEFGTDDELEIRFGKFSSESFFELGHQSSKNKTGTSSFNTGIDKKFIDDFLTKGSGVLFDSKWVENNEELVLVSGLNSDLRNIFKLSRGKVISKVTEKKTRLGNVDLIPYGVRISVSHEEIIEKDMSKSSKKINYMRYKNRNSYKSLDGNWRFDVTKVFSTEVDSIDVVREFKEKLLTDEEIENLKYEFEIEYIGEKMKDLEEIINNIQQVFGTLVELIIPDIVFKRIKNEVYSQIGTLLGINENSGTLDFRRNLISNVVTLEFNNIANLNVEDYAVTEKADGERMLLFINQEGSMYLINSRNEIISIAGKTGSDMRNTLIDCEYLLDDLMLLAFDVLVCNGERYVYYDLRTRLSCLKGILDKIRFDDKTKLKCKKFVFKDDPSGEIYKCVEKVWDKFRGKKKSGVYEIDGLIFTPAFGNYMDKSFKWKLAEELSVDFLIRLVNVGSTETEFWLFVGATPRIVKLEDLVMSEEEKMKYESWFGDKLFNSNYFPVLFAPMFKFKMKNKDIKKYNVRDNIIVELLWDRSEWVFNRVREDRTEEYLSGGNVYGNYWNTAMNNWKMIQKPITYDMLIGKEKVPFFAAERGSKLIDGMKKFHSHIKKNLYDLGSGGKNVFEFAIGRNGDIFKWVSSKFKCVYGIDIDENALQDGKLFVEQLELDGVLKSSNVPKIETRVLSGDDKYETISTSFGKKFKEGMFDIVSCQFGIHFFMQNKESLSEFARNVSMMMSKKGIFIATTLDGNKVNRLFNNERVEKDEFYEIKKKDIKIISFQKLYGTVYNVKTYGAEMNVYIESIGGLNKEWLVVRELLVEEFEKVGIELEFIDFRDYYEPWMKKNKEKTKMSEGEKTYSFLGMAIVGRWK